MFQTVPLSIISSFSLHTPQWYMLYILADTLQAGSGQNFLILHASCRQTCVYCCVYSVKLLMMDRRTV